jgi:biotin operon repressor
VSAAGNKPRPPMAKAAREFLRGMKLPKIGRMPDENFKVCGLVSVMLLFASGLREDADCAVCSPSQSQLAELMHCSRPTIERMIRKLRETGVVSKLNRGRTSCIYTIHKTPQQVMEQTKQADPSTQVPRPINSNPSTHQQEPFVPSTVDTHWVSPLGRSSLGKSSLGNATAESQPQKTSSNEESQNKHQTQEQIRTSPEVLELSRSLARDLGFRQDRDNVRTLKECLCFIADQRKISHAEAKNLFWQQVLNDKTSGIAIDRTYLIMKASELGQNATAQ